MANPYDSAISDLLELMEAFGPFEDAGHQIPFPMHSRLHASKFLIESVVDELNGLKEDSS